MTNVIDSLERELSKAVRTHAPTQHRRIRSRGRRLAMIAVTAALPLSVGALAATLLRGAKDPQTQGRQIALRAVKDTSTLPACATSTPTGHVTFASGSPGRQIAAALPVFALPSSARQQQAAAAHLHSSLATKGSILRSTLRTFELAGGTHLLAYVQLGAGPGAVRDPVGCAHARADRAAALSTGYTSAVGRSALRTLGERRETASDVQTLWVFAQRNDAHRYAATGIPVRPDEPLRPGVIMSSSVGHHASLYVGIAHQGTTRILIKTRPGIARPTIPTQVPVTDGFYAITLPPGTGPVRLIELTGAGIRLGGTTVR